MMMMIGRGENSHQFGLTSGYLSWIFNYVCQDNIKKPLMIDDTSHECDSIEFHQVM